MKYLMVVLILLSPACLFADEQSDRAAIEQLFEVTNSKSMVDHVYMNAERMARGMASQMGIKESEKQDFEKYMAKVMALLKEEVSWEKMKEPLIKVYMKHYTKKEIKEILAFYKTKTGQSLIEKMPLVINDSMAISQNMLREFLPKIEDINKEMIKEIHSRQ